MTITMESITAHRYGGVHLKAGERFEVSGTSHARLLAALGRAKEVTAEPAEEPQPVSAVSGFKPKPLSAQSATDVARAETSAPKGETRAAKAETAVPKPETVPAAPTPEPAAPAPEKPPAATTEPSAPAAAVGATTTKDDPAKRGTYKRRDLKAEE